jgi:predicted metal-dependent enzyme (double-stranded beta helix superfamily)
VRPVAKAKGKLLYRPVGLLAGGLAGVVAGAVVKRVWRLAAGEEDTPDALDEQRGWGEIMAAALLQGAVFAVVRAAVDRASAQGVRRLTGRWPV